MVATHISDGKKRKVTDTDTTNVNSPQKLLINRLIPDIIPVIILPITPWIADGFASSSGTLHARQKISSKEIVTDLARGGAHVFKDPTVVNWKDTYGEIPQDGNTVGIPPILTTPVYIGDRPSVSPTRMRSQDIGSPSGSISPQEVRNALPFDTSINVIYDKYRDPAPTFSEVIGQKFSDEYSSDVYSLCRMNLIYDTILAESPNFINIGLLAVHTSYELRSVFIPATRIGNPADGSNCLPPGHIIGEVTADRMSRTRSEQNYSYKTDFENRIKNQDFGRQNISMSRPPLGSTPLGTNTNNRKCLQLTQFQSGGKRQTPRY